nr:TRAP transporter small permease subunit [Halochromatium roseum]
MRLAQWLEWVNRAVGAVVSWLALAMVLMTFIVVVLRYVFDSGSIALQESVTYMYAMLFMLGAAYTLQQDGHVRVDILYQGFSRRGRAWVDLLGTLFLLVPVAVFLLASSWTYVADSWAVFEGSREAGGIPGVWLLKTLLLVMPVLMLVQGLIWVLRNGLFLAGVDAALGEPDKASAGNADG